jgi:hypothetical protein
MTKYIIFTSSLFVLFLGCGFASDREEEQPRSVQSRVAMFQKTSNQQQEEVDRQAAQRLQQQERKNAQKPFPQYQNDERLARQLADQERQATAQWKQKQLMEDYALAQSLASTSLFDKQKHVSSNNSSYQPLVQPTFPTRRYAAPNDAASIQLAQKLQAEEEKKQRQQEKEDLDLARTLQQQENEKHQTRLPQPVAKKSLPVALKPLLTTAKLNLDQQLRAQPQEGLDVHAFNRSYVLSNKDIVLQILQHLQLTQFTPQQVITQARSLKIPEFTHFEQSVQKLTTHLQKKTIDIETQLNVPQMISACWALCQQFEDKPRFSIPAFHRLLTAKEYFVFSMDENIMTRGGCFPGYAGRFFSMAVILLSALYE